MTKFKIYTKTGDKGETSLFSGHRVLKNDPLVDALGTVDECNSAIGAAISFMKEQKELEKVVNQLIHIQHTLFDLGAAIATPKSKSSIAKLEKTRFDHDGVAILEKWIDEWEEKLPQLNTFILPGGGHAGSFLHLARSISRRAERVITELKTQDISENVIMYINRLSDYLFVVSRYVNFLTNKPESKWEMHRENKDL